ncbi:MAG: Usg family protein [Rhodospirillales bacterium]|nr:Usg family protein [Alphaproteobacteria bacterium]USO03873.1 MAG: Usg family protein [Rhodospirillales bacterium]
MSDLEIQLGGFRLTTAQIFYHMPDHPQLIQEFVWQDYDLAPKFPKLHGFLGFWTRKLDGPIHSVYVAKKEIITPGDVRLCACEFFLQ